MNQDCLEQYEYMNSKLVIEEVTEELGNEKIVIPNADKSQIMLTLVMYIILQHQEHNLKDKQQFLHSQNYSSFQQVLAISNITINFSNDDPFFRHITMVFKLIRKAIKRRLMPHHIKSKEEFAIHQNDLFRIFYQDINIGFITSTGQIKSTAFIFLHKSIKDLLSKRMVVESKKERVRLTMHFYCIENIIKIPYVQQEYKHSFLRTNKFKNEFIVLNEELDKQQSLFHVYKPVDDQIYFVKRMPLQIPLNSTFIEVFTTKETSIWKARVLSTLSHPNIIRLYDWWLEIFNLQPYLFMQIEYCTYPGYISQAKNLLSYSYFYINPMHHEQKQKFIIDIIQQILTGVEFLQLRKIHHGDLKPESIMVTTTVTGDIQIVLADLSPPQHQTKSQENTFYEIGVLIMHLILTFPGEPTLRNNYITQFQNIQFEESLALFDGWAQKSVKNKHREFTFFLYQNLMQLAKSLLTQTKFHDLHELAQFIKKII